MPTYVKHYWTDSVGNYQTVRNQSVDRRHPVIDGLTVKYWLKDERGVDYCLSVCPDTTVIDTPPVGIQVLTKTEWDAIVATIPPAPPAPEPPKPDWEKFRSSIATAPEMQAILSQAIQTVPQSVVTLTTAVYQLDSGDYGNFRTSWNDVLNAYSNQESTEVPQIDLNELKQRFRDLAQSCNLPGDFINILN